MKATQQKIIETKTATFAEPRRTRFGKKWILLVAIFIILAGAAFYFFTKYQELKNNPEAANDAEVAALVEEIGMVMVLPEGETPTLATVSDPELLQGQAFFRNAKEGDKVLIYTTAGKVILYDPIAKKIVEVAPIAAGEGVSQE